MRVARAGVVLFVLLTMGANAHGAQRLYPLVSGWEQWFRVDSQVLTRAGHPVVSGTVWNISSWNAKRIQLLVEGLDAGEMPVSQQVMWLGLNLPSGTHAYFEVPPPASVPAPASYRVSVFAFDGAKGRWG